VTESVLDVADLRVTIGKREIVRDVALTVEREQTLGIVGESGSGKSMTVLAATGLLDAPGAIVAGSSVLGGEPVTELVANASTSARRPDRVRIPGPGNVVEPAADP
jgi:peptide/nickel transport system ATP-binding protein